MSPTARRSRGRPRDEHQTTQRRRQIVETAAHCFARRGYAETDVQEIADALQIGKGTIYRYFPSKQELFLAAVDHGVRQLKSVIDQAVAKAATPLQRIEQAVRAFLGYFDRNPDLIELIVQERTHFRDRPTPTYFVHREENLKPWRALLRHLIDEGVIRNVPVDRIIDVLSDLLYGTIFTNYFARRRKSLARQCEDILDIAFHGLLRKEAETRRIG